MRILVASTITPLVAGGSRKIADDLTSVLATHGHEVEQLLIPFMSDPEVMVEQMLAIRLTDVSAACDLLIALRTPIYLLRHPNKVLWFLHHHRGAYDLWGTPFCDIPDSFRGRTTRANLRAADEVAFAEAKRIFAISGAVASRLWDGNGVRAAVLHPPLSADHEPPAPQGPGDFVFFPSRIAGNKRQRLAIESMRHVTSGVRLVLAGAADTPNQREDLERVIAEHALEDRVELISRWISDEEKQELMARSLATLYVPYQEDYGYVALESLEAGKPLITCSDSGGPLELIEHGRHGLVAEPTPVSVAEAIDRLARDREAAQRMGAAALRQPAQLGIGWDAVVAALTA